MESKPSKGTIWTYCSNKWSQSGWMGVCRIIYHCPSLVEELWMRPGPSLPPFWEWQLPSGLGLFLRGRGIFPMGHSHCPDDHLVCLAEMRPLAVVAATRSLVLIREKQLHGQIWPSTEVRIVSWAQTGCQHVLLLLVTDHHPLQVVSFL